MISMAACISLLTDFGLRDEYVGVMKAVVATINPRARVIDITHQIPPQDIIQAALVLKAAYRYFPAGTVHLAVVDPGVGTSRPVVAAKVGRYFFLGPDNGVLWPAIEDSRDKETHIVTVTNSDFFLPKASRTFHGRDVFAPLAAHLSLGVELERLGPAIGLKEMVHLERLEPFRHSDGSLRGTVTGIDRFGNLLTNIGRCHLVDLAGGSDLSGLEISAGPWKLQGLAETYAEVPAGEPLALIGSRDTLELAVNQGSAAKVAGIGRAEPVVVRPAKAGNS